MGTRAERKEDFGGGFGFGVVENSHKDVMVLPNHHHHHHHHHQSSFPSPSSSSYCYCSTGCTTDPMFSASSNTQASYTPSNEMFCLAGSGSGSVSLADPFFTLSPSGEIGRCMSDKTSVAFSEAQWQELERQRNIYKYIMASVPVPCELLSPFPKNHPDVAMGKGGSLKLGIASNASNNTGDLEPWRCKRTDGKKWRCSRNVIPDLKYCERHTHKSRPRSRKHVESSHHNDTTRTAKTDTTNQFSRTYPQFYGQPETQFSVPVSTLPSDSSSYDHHRGLRWLMKENDPITTLSPEIQLKVGSSRELKENGLGFNYDLNLKQKEPLVDQSFGALQGLLSLNQTPQETRRFISDRDEAMGSSLTLSMAGAMEEAECRNQNQWVSHERPSWVCSTTPGGPLAEALCLGVSNNPITSTTTSSCSRSSS